MSRIRGYCQTCGDPVYYNKAVLCWNCHKAKKAATAADNVVQTDENRKAARRNWYYNNRDHAQAKHREWLENNRDKVKQYELEHIDERRFYVETRRARLLNADAGLTAEIWNMMLEWYAGKCVYCMGPAEPLEQDHVVPLSKGGRHSMDNVVPACKACNRKKSTGYMEVQHPVYYIISKLLEEAATSV